MLKNYFIKASIIDYTQPLKRKHFNRDVELDLDEEYYTVQSAAAKQIFESWERYDDFVIDFMIEKI